MNKSLSTGRVSLDGDEERREYLAENPIEKERKKKKDEEAMRTLCVLWKWKSGYVGMAGGKAGKIPSHSLLSHSSDWHRVGV